MIDLLAFDLGGVFLFQSDWVSRFFAQRRGRDLAAAGLDHRTGCPAHQQRAPPHF